MKPRTLTRLIGNLLGIRRRRYQSIVRYRRWLQLARTEGALKEAILCEPDYYRRIDLAGKLHQHRLNMMVFQMSEDQR